MPFRALAVMAVLGFLACFTVIASPIYLLGVGLYNEFDYPFFQWWIYLWYHPTGPGAEWLLYSGVFGSLAGFGVIAALVYRTGRAPTWSLRWPPQRSSLTTDPPRVRSGMHGHARWATPRERRRRWPGPGPVVGGVVIGEDYDPQDDKGPFYPHDRRTWARGGRKRLLIDPCEEGPTHGIVVASSGGFKSMCFVSTLLYWKTSAVVLDPARELGPMVRGFRERTLGHRVFFLDTATSDKVAFNVLDWIDIATRNAEGDVRAVVEWVCGSTPAASGSGNGRFFKNRGKAIVACFVAHILWSDDISPDRKNLVTMRDWISAGQDEIRKLLKLIAAKSRSRLARLIAGAFDKVPDDTWGGIVASADDDTSWLTVLANAQLVSGNSFRSRDITHGDTDVFIQLSLKILDASPGLGRCIVGALLNAVYEADGAIHGRALFLLDEAKQLGYMRALKVARDAGRKVGITILLGYQSEAQIEEQWAGRVGKEEWYQTVSWTSFSVINDLTTAERISKACGTYGGLTQSESFRRYMLGGQSNQGQISYSDRPFHLIRPEQVLTDLRRDTQIIMPGSGEPPVRCGRAIYFRRPDLVKLVTDSRFATRDHGLPLEPLPESEPPTEEDEDLLSDPWGAATHDA